MIASMRWSDSTIPPWMGIGLASIDVPAPQAVTEMRCPFASAKTWLTY
jgi:hypothetical protein